VSVATISATTVVAHIASDAGLSSLWFLGLVFVLAAFGMLGLWWSGRRSRPADDDIAEFSRGLQALAPKSEEHHDRELVSFGSDPNRRQR